MPMLRKTLVLSVAASCTALSPATRRDLLRATPVVAAPFLAAPAVAEDFQASLKPLYKAAKTAKLTYRSKAGEPPPEAWAEDAFVGRYTDPINHPGGTSRRPMDFVDSSLATLDTPSSRHRLDA